MSTEANVFLQALADGLALPPDFHVDEWADEHRYLSPISSAEHGKWRTDRVPYTRGVMRALSPQDPCRFVVWMKGSQIAATETGLNWDGYNIHHDPGPILNIVPDLEFARLFSKERIAPMIETTPVLRDRVKDPKERDSGNTLLVKEFPGGIWILTGSNRASRLKSMPIRYLHVEEPDEFAQDVGARKDVEGQGGAVGLALKRIETYGDRAKVFINGTPTISGLSEIASWYLASDRRRFFIPCPACGHMDYLTWEGPDKLSENQGTHHRIGIIDREPATAHMVCSSCQERVEESFKTEMLGRGDWIPTAVSPKGIVGFHLSSLYSPLGWKSWASCAEEFFQGLENPQDLKIFVNQTLGELYEERSTEVKSKTLLDRREIYSAEVPEGVGALVASVDVQADRFEIAVKGYGAGEQSWLVAYEVLEADTAKDIDYHRALDPFLERKFVHESGRELKILRMTVDSGYRTEQVYRYCKSRASRGVFATKGDPDSRGKPVVTPPSRRNQYRAALFLICTDTAKENIYERLTIGEPGPGYMHFPHWTTEQYFKGLTAEKFLWKYTPGKRPKRVWKKVYDRNEPLDCEVGCLAALYIGGQEFVRNLAARAAELSKPLEGKAAAPAPAESTRPGLPRPGRTGRWIGKWRR